LLGVFDKFVNLHPLQFRYVDHVVHVDIRAILAGHRPGFFARYLFGDGQGFATGFQLAKSRIDFRVLTEVRAAPHFARTMHIATLTAPTCR
jgi:hypothetical protein